MQKTAFANLHDYLLSNKNGNNLYRLIKIIMNLFILISKN